MAVWLSYSLSDFLLFTPHTYYRLFELYNRAIWPVHAAGRGARPHAPGAVVLWRRTARTRDCRRARRLLAVGGVGFSARTL